MTEKSIGGSSNYSNERLLDSLIQGPLKVSVAISGGGHRATLYGMGFLMALIDRGLGPRIIQVTSVSGGSILNAALVQQGIDLQKVSPSEFYSACQSIAQAICRRGLLGWTWIALFVTICCAFGVACGTLAYFAPIPYAVVGLIALLGFFIPFMGSGKLLEWRLRRVLFNHEPTTLGETETRSSVEHVFCASDLLTGFPVYFTTWAGGRLFRRTSLQDLETDSYAFSRLSGQYSPGGHYRFDEIVRASAGFPGIAPKRLRARREDGSPGALMFLGDGGIVNNLGTQYLREENLLWGQYESSWPVLLLGANASTPMKSMKPRESWLLHVPLASLFLQLVRYLTVMNYNSVIPRLAAMDAALSQRRVKMLAGSNIIMHISFVTKAAGIAGHLLAQPVQGLLFVAEVLAWSTAEPSDTEQKLHPVTEALKILDHMRHTLERKSDDEVSKSISDGMIAPGDKRLDWPVELLQADWLEGLHTTVKTTLGRMKPEIIKNLILRGYMHGYAVSQGFSSAAGQRQEIAAGDPLRRIRSIV